MIQFAEARNKLFINLQKAQVEGITSIASFWKTIEELRNHSVILDLENRLKALMGHRCVGFALIRENIYRTMLNLREDSLRYILGSSFLPHVFAGDPFHMGFILSKEEKLFLSHMNTASRHEVTLNKRNIFYPSCFIFNFSIHSLLSKRVTVEHAHHLQAFFLDALKEMAGKEQPITLEPLLVKIQSFCLGMRTPFWDRNKVTTLQSKELCSGVTAKTVYQAYLKTAQKMQEMGYDKEEIAPLFKERDHLGRLTVSACLQHFKQKGVIEPLEDPVITAFIAADPRGRTPF